MPSIYVKNETIRKDTVPLDGHHYIKCKFIDCTILYSGGDWNWTECSFEKCNFKFEGAAQRTQALVATLKKRNQGPPVAPSGPVN